MPGTVDTVEESRKTFPIMEEAIDDTLRVRSVKICHSEPKWKTYPRWVYTSLGLAFVIVLAVSWWLHARHFETTDDARIDGHINVISSRISGTVLYVNPRVENNQHVEAGTLLAEL